MKNLNHTIEINGKEIEVSFTHALPSGNGHYRIHGEASMYPEALKISFVTSNMGAIDTLKGEDEEASDEMRHDFAIELSEQCHSSIVSWIEQLAIDAAEESEFQ